LPTQKTAVLSRMILLNFENNKFSPDQRKAFAELEKNQDNGFGKVLTDILKHRDFFQKNFKRTFDKNMKELREIIPVDFAERTLKHVALLLTPAKILHEKMQLPFTFREITNAVVENAIEQNQLLKQTDEITIFWAAFAWGIKNGSLVQFREDEVGNNLKKSHFNLKIDKAGEAILQIKLPGIYPEYVRYCKNNNQRSLDSNSLRMLLTSNSYSSFIPTNQKGRGVYHTDTHFKTCYQYRLNNENGEKSINGVELNL